MKAAIYARYSSDLQSDRSIEDQIALCRTYAARQGYAVGEIYTDYARSGASIMGRDGLLSMMDAARAGEFGVLIIEALDRVSRDQEDLAGVYKRLTHFGVEIRAVHDGRADIVQIGIRGLVGAIYLQDLANKVRRGLAGVVREGRHAGGRAYGYRPIAGRPGELEICEPEAEIVQRIFRDYVAGFTPRDLAATLNREGVPPPRGTHWNASTINGSTQRGYGIIQNELYAGRIVWNRVRMIKDPDTGKRLSRTNPRDEWQTVEAPHLAIIDADLFAAARDRKAKASHAGMQGARRPKHMLSGLLRCGACGGGMQVHDRDKTGKTRIRCSTVSESGTCDHRRVYYRETVEQAVLHGLKRELAEPRLIAEYVKTYQEERRRLAADSTARCAKLEHKLGEIRRSITRLVDALASGMASADSVRERLLDLENEKRQAEADLADASTTVDVIALHPAAVRRYLEQIEQLSMDLQSAAGFQSIPSAEWFRSLVERVIVHPTPARAPLDIELRGHLSSLLSIPNMAPKARHSGGPLVAGEGLEPPTPGL